MVSRNRPLLLNTLLLGGYLLVAADVTQDFLRHLRIVERTSEPWDDFLLRITFCSLLSSIIAISGSVFVFRRLIATGRRTTIGWWIQAIGGSGYGICYLIWLSNFMSNAGSFA